MSWCRDIQQVDPHESAQFGGKATALAELQRRGFLLPETLCIGVDAYRQFVCSAGLRERILLELHRKHFGDMRWEEIWDAALRIRNFFLRTAIPAVLAEDLRARLERRFGQRPVAVRSSAPGEDTERASFAGLHDSFLNVCGADAMLIHIRLVWASLWSDRALLYRQELGLDIERSAMAVVVQAMVDGERSGVVFSRHPQNARQTVIEAVYGLNEGLVDGTVEPDRWLLDRRTGRILAHHPPARRQYAVRPVGSGTALSPLPEGLDGLPPLNPEQARQVWSVARRAEQEFGGPRDLEWTYRASQLFTLQCRPLTSTAPEDERSWYLSLHRSYENLRRLQQQIEGELIPEMMAVAAALEQVPLAKLSSTRLADELRKRQMAVDHWRHVYRQAFIPFAHGVRLFAQVYNDRIGPENPYEFLSLLAATDLWSVRRNQALAGLAALASDEDAALPALAAGRLEQASPEFGQAVADFMAEFGALFEWAGGGEAPEQQLAGLLRELGRQPAAVREVVAPPQDLAAAFVGSFPCCDRERANELLELARASYRLRDDDNLHLGQIEAQQAKAIRLARARLRRTLGERVDGLPESILPLLLRDPKERTSLPDSLAPVPQPARRRIVARQLVGQPAGPGIATGVARVMVRREQFLSFRRGEILVCDAIDPNLTFVVPLAAAIVERRGGMLIHGAIIAREYGLPCVTGVPDATEAIPDGAQVTVDGYLGIVTVETPPVLPPAAG